MELLVIPVDEKTDKLIEDYFAGKKIKTKKLQQNPQAAPEAVSAELALLSCEPNREQLEKACLWLPYLEYNSATLVEKQIMRGRAAGWLRAWQHILAT